MLKISSLHPQSLPLWEQVPLGNIWTRLLCPGPASPLYGHLPPSSCGAPGSPCTLPPLHRSDSLSPPAPPSPGPWLPSANLFVKRCSKLFFFFFLFPWLHSLQSSRQRQDAGCRLQGPGMQGPGMQGEGCEDWDVGCRDGCEDRDAEIRDVGCRDQDVGCRVQDVG